MNRYDFVSTGAVCPNRCDYCSQCGGEYLDQGAVASAVERLAQPYDLYLGEGNAAGFPHLIEVLDSALAAGLRRVKLKTTGSSLLEEGKLKELLRFGVMLYEVEFLGPSARVADAVAKRKGAFEESRLTAGLIRSVVNRDPSIRDPFLFLTVPILPGNVRRLRETTGSLIKHGPDRAVYRFGGGVSLTEAVSELRTCLAELLRAGIWPVLSGIPFCVVPGLEYHCQEVYDRQTFAGLHDFCEECVFKEVCCGVDARYLAEFGSVGLEAVRSHKHAQSISRIASMETALLPGKAPPPSARR